MKVKFAIFKLEFFCLFFLPCGCNGCQEIKSYLPLMPFLFLGIQGLIGHLCLAKNASDLAKNFCKGG